MKVRNQTDPAAREYLRQADLLARYGISRVTFWEWRRRGVYPEGVELAPGVRRWPRGLVDAWEAARAAQSEAR